jgi:hypothetical protein
MVFLQFPSKANDIAIALCAIAFCPGVSATWIAFARGLAGLLAASHQIQDGPGSNVRGERIRRRLEGLAVQCQRFIQLSRVQQLLTLLDELRLLLLGAWSLRECTRDTNRKYEKSSENYGGSRVHGSIISQCRSREIFVVPTVRAIKPK